MRHATRTRAPPFPKRAPSPHGRWGTPGYVTSTTNTLLTTTSTLLGTGVSALGGNTTAIENTYEDLTTPADEELQVWYRGAGVVMLILTCCVLIWLCFNCDAIQQCIAVVQEVNAVFLSMPVLMVYGLLWTTPWAVGLAFFTFFGCYFIGYPTVWDDRNTIATLLVYHLLVMIWAWSVVLGVAYTATAHCVARWFFEIQSPQAQRRASAQGSKKGAATCCNGCFGVALIARSTVKTIFCHIGSIIFGAAVVAVARLITIMLAAMAAYAKRENAACLIVFILKCVATPEPEHLPSPSEHLPHMAGTS